jgi:hypothetical protein
MWSVAVSSILLVRATEIPSECLDPKESTLYLKSLPADYFNPSDVAHRQCLTIDDTNVSESIDLLQTVYSLHQAVSKIKFIQGQTVLSTLSSLASYNKNSTTPRIKLFEILAGQAITIHIQTVPEFEDWLFSKDGQIFLHLCHEISSLNFTRQRQFLLFELELARKVQTLRIANLDEGTLYSLKQYSSLLNDCILCQLPSPLSIEAQNFITNHVTEISHGNFSADQMDKWENSFYYENAHKIKSLSIASQSQDLLTDSYSSGATSSESHSNDDQDKFEPESNRVNKGENSETEGECASQIIVARNTSSFLERLFGLV